MEKIDISLNKGKKLKRSLVGICKMKSIRTLEDIEGILLNLDIFKEKSVAEQHLSRGLVLHYDTLSPAIDFFWGPPTLAYGYDVYFTEFSNSKGEKV